MAGYMVLQSVLSNGGEVELIGPNVKYWAGTGLPDYEGGIDGLREAFPAVFAELLQRKLIREV
jgi:hypothetical protein